MAGQKGRDMLLRVSDGGDPPVFSTLAGIRAKTLSMTADAVDATSAESPDAWRELIAGAGVKRIVVSGAGVFKDQPSDARMRALFFDQDAARWRLVVPDFGTFEGAFLITELNYSGDHDGEAAFAVTLESAGAVTFEAV